MYILINYTKQKDLEQHTCLNMQNIEHFSIFLENTSQKNQSWLVYPEFGEGGFS